MPGTIILATDLGHNATGKRRFAVAGEVVDIEATAEGEVVVGRYEDLARERQHHRDLWTWCLRHGIQPPSELRPG